MEPHGLKGIEPVRKNYIRPLIECDRDQIEQYCEENQLAPRIDCTNMENIYTRNKIRNQLIPYLKKEFNPNIIKSLNRLASIVKEENDYLDRMTEAEFGNIVIEESKDQIIADLKSFNKLEIVIKRRLILYTINKLLRNC